MTSSEIRNSFLKFFKDRGHRIVPSASVIPYDDPTLLFTNAGMNQFKDVFLGAGKRDYTRAADSQKCIRVSGKHNDLEEVGRDTYHHTFFEMLGNWSFGDYYKKEAIEWAWELLTKVWGLEKKRLYATVFEADDEAFELWNKVTDIDPSHVLRFGKKDNFWEMGETGPCGPCSEIHIDLSEKGDCSHLVNAGDPRVMEIWNLVFIQYDRDEKGELTPLPAKHVDTGMGFERVCAVLQGKKSNYDTDVFAPIINRIEELTGHAYLEHNQAPIRAIADHIRMLTFSIADSGTPSNTGRGYVMRRILRRAAFFGWTLDVKEPFLYRVVESVVKTMGGQFPEIREKQSHIERIIKGEEESFGRTLDTGMLMFYRYAFETIADQLRKQGHEVDAFWDDERSQFTITRLDVPEGQTYLQLCSTEWNTKVLEQMTDKPIIISGEDAFKLYDTYGFPLDLTEMMAKERGLTVDSGRFVELMEEQRDRSKRQTKAEWMMGPAGGAWGDSIDEALKEHEEKLRRSDFDYEDLVAETKLDFQPLTYKSPEKDAYDRGIILEKTTFYTEAGGQVSDSGLLTFKLSPSETRTVRVKNVVKRIARTVHILDCSGSDLDIDRLLDTYISVETQIDVPRSLNIMRNHTATHLVHEALRQVLGTHLHQQGSLVAPDRLRFDFNHLEKISPDQIRAIEDIVNEKIAEALPVTAENNPDKWITIEQAKKQYPNLKMFFGEKYGDKVRVVQVKNFCAELCGGTHVRNTKEIGLFKIVSEGSVASGIRRIEAVTGDGLAEFIRKEIEKVGEMDGQIERLLREKEDLDRLLGEFTKHVPAPRPSLDAVRLPSSITKVTLTEVDRAIRQREETIEHITKSTNDLKKELSKYRVKDASSGIDEIVARATSLDGFKVASSRVEASSMDELQNLGDVLRSKLSSGVGVLGSVINEKVALVCVVTDDLIKGKKLQAGKIVGELAKRVGGGGGGRPHLATAGGKDVSKLDETLSQASAVVKSMLGV